MKTITNKKLINPIWLMLLSLLMTSPAFADQHTNAALDYCRAALLHKTPDNSVHKTIEQMLRSTNIEPNRQIRQYVDDNFEAIEIAIRAAEAPNCDFQWRFSDGFEMQIPCVFGCGDLSKAILANAKVLEAKGDYDEALQLCLTARKISVHLTNQQLLMSQLVGLKINMYTSKCMQSILGNMPEDTQKLKSLQSQLDEIEKFPFSLKPSFYMEYKVMAMYMTKSKVAEIDLEPLIAGSSLKDIAKERLAVADNEFFIRNQQYWEKHMNTFISTLDLPYAEAFAEMKKEYTRVAKDAIENPDATLTSLLSPPVHKSLSTAVNIRTRSNAIRTAIAVYLIKAKTGELLDTLPNSLPKDLFSGKDFEYKKMADGFVLRCQGMDLEKNKIHEYEFKVKK